MPLGLLAFKQMEVGWPQAPLKPLARAGHGGRSKGSGIEVELAEDPQLELGGAISLAHKRTPLDVTEVEADQEGGYDRVQGEIDIPVQEIHKRHAAGPPLKFSAVELRGILILH